MRRTLILCAGALLIAAPASAHEKHGKHAKVSKAHLEATEAATAAGIPDARGRAHLVDGRKHDHVTLHMKGLERRRDLPLARPPGDRRGRPVRRRQHGRQPGAVSRLDLPRAEGARLRQRELQGPVEHLPGRRGGERGRLLRQRPPPGRHRDRLRRARAQARRPPQGPLEARRRRQVQARRQVEGPRTWPSDTTDPSPWGQLPMSAPGAGGDSRPASGPLRSRPPCPPTPGGACRGRRELYLERRCSSRRSRSCRSSSRSS